MLVMGIILHPQYNLVTSMNKNVLVTIILLITLAITMTACTSRPAYTPSEITAPTPAPTLKPPEAPSNLAATPSKNYINLYWNDNSSDEQGFRIYRDGSPIATLPSNTTTYQDIGLQPATTYQYRITAFNQIGESGTNILSVKTPNPPVRVRLDRIGVHDNGEEFLRDIDGGEIYIGIIITDGNKVVETRLPTQEGQFFNLYDEDIKNVGTILFSTNEVGDYLRIACVGYESDGGPGETLIYKALGTAAESYLTGGTTSLLGIDLGLGNIIGTLLGAEDDWLGSFEKAWDSSNDWGVGTYTDIGCPEPSGTIGLRLWFTIETG
jgi:hypothetical protein